MYKVFFKERVLFLCNKTEILDFKGQVFEWTGASLQEFIVKFETREESLPMAIVWKDREKLFAHFRSYFQYIEAAGGRVYNNKQEVLMIYRLGKWDLPKGKVEEGESPEKAAIREVREECGISEIGILKKLLPTYHIYRIEKKLMLKKTHWFEMEHCGSEKPKPQIEEAITEAKWISEKQLGSLKSASYASIWDVLSN